MLPQTPPLTRALPSLQPRYYPAEDKLVHKVTKGKSRPTKLRASLTPGTVVIIVSGPYRGKVRACACAQRRRDQPLASTCGPRDDVRSSPFAPPLFLSPLLARRLPQAAVFRPLPCDWCVQRRADARQRKHAVKPSR